MYEELLTLWRTFQNVIVILVVTNSPETVGKLRAIWKWGLQDGSSGEGAYKQT